MAFLLLGLVEAMPEKRECRPRCGGVWTGFTCMDEPVDADEEGPSPDALCSST